MGWVTAQNVMNHTEASKLTWRDLACLHIIAFTVLDTGKRRRLINGIDDETSMLRTRLSARGRMSRSDVYEVLKNLEAAGLIGHITAVGRRPAVWWTIDPTDPEWRPGNPDPKAEVKGPGKPRIASGKTENSVPEIRTLSGAANPDGIRDRGLSEGAYSTKDSTKDSTKSSLARGRTQYDQLAAIVPMSRERYDQLLDNLSDAGKKNPRAYVGWALKQHQVGDDTEAVGALVASYLDGYEPRGSRDTFALDSPPYEPGPWSSAAYRSEERTTRE